MNRKLRHSSHEESDDEKEISRKAKLAASAAPVSGKNLYGTFKFARKLLGYLGAPLFYGFAFLASLLLIRAFVNQTTAIICSIPPATHLLSFCQASARLGSIPEFKKLESLQSKFEGIQEAAAGGVTLPLLMKRGEAAIAEVGMLIEISNVPSKVELGGQIKEFGTLARTAGNDLRRFNSHLDLTMDSIISTNEWTLRRLHKIASAEEDRNLPKGVLDKALVIFKTSDPPADIAVRKQYIRHLDKLKDDLDSLIVEAQLSIYNLETVENQLNLIKMTAIRDQNQVTDEQRKESRKFAAIFGLNSNEVYDLGKQGIILHDLRTYQNTAFMHVTGVLETLHRMSIDLENLRTRMAIPQLFVESDSLPIEVQIDIIARGLRKLDQEREKSKKIKKREMRRISEQMDNRFK